MQFIIGNAWSILNTTPGQLCRISLRSLKPFGSIGKCISQSRSVCPNQRAFVITKSQWLLLTSTHGLLSMASLNQCSSNIPRNTFIPFIISTLNFQTLTYYTYCWQSLRPFASEVRKPIRILTALDFLPQCFSAV